MALADAILEIADDMQKEYVDYGMETVPIKVFELYMKQLRSAVKAAEGGQPRRALGVDPELVKQDRERQQALREARHQEQTLIDAGAGSVEMYVCEGGNSEGTFVPTGGVKQPDGAKCVIGGQVYTVQGSKLVYSGADAQ